MKEEGIALQNFIEISSLETLLSSVKARLTATLLPRSVITGAYEGLHIHTIPEPYRLIETGLIRRRDKHTSSAYEAFAKLLNAQGL